MLSNNMTAQAMDRSQGARIWMASEATDMRCGFDRLAERVNTVVGENPQSGHLFRVPLTTW
jgi:transposase